MLYDMWAAIALSTGNKAKARDKHGDIVVVERQCSHIQCIWWLHCIGKKNTHDTGGFFDGRVGELSDVLLDRHGLNMNAITWLPVETPFPDECDMLSKINMEGLKRSIIEGILASGEGYKHGTLCALAVMFDIDLGHIKGMEQSS